jgi:hypothetical protein
MKKRPHLNGKESVSMSSGTAGACVPAGFLICSHLLFPLAIGGPWLIRRIEKNARNCDEQTDGNGKYAAPSDTCKRTIPA